MDITVDRIRSLFRLFLTIPSGNLADTLNSHLKLYYNNKGYLANDKLFVEFFTSLLPIYSANKKNHHILFEKAIEINSNLIKIIKVETINLFIRIVRIITNLLVDMDEKGDLIIVKQNDTIKLHILDILNNFIMENSLSFRMLLEETSLINFYGYLCATLKLVVHQSVSTKVFEKCLDFYKLAPKYLLESSSDDSSNSKMKIARCILPFLPGILSVLLEIFKNKSHMKNNLKNNTLETFYMYIGVLLDDRWCQLECIGQIMMDPLQNNIVSNPHNTQNNESKKRISSLLKEIVNLVFYEDINEMYINLATLIDYLWRYCSKLNFTRLLVDISTKILSLDNNCESAKRIIVECLKDYSSKCSDNKNYLIQYYSNLCKKTIDNLLSNNVLNILDNLKLLKVCLLVCGNSIHIEYITLNNWLLYLADLIRDGFHINSTTKDIKLYSNVTITSWKGSLDEINLKNEQPYTTNRKYPLTEYDMNIVDDILHLMVYCDYFMDINSLCMDTMSNDMDNRFLLQWPYIHIITSCIKACNQPKEYLLSSIIICSDNINSNKDTNLENVIHDVHQYIFGDHEEFFRKLNGGQCISQQYQLVLYELGNVVNLMELQSYSFTNKHTIQMCLNIFNFIEESSFILSCDYVDRYLIRIIYILLMIRCTMAMYPIVCEASYCCLNNITKNIHYNNVKELIFQFKEIIIDEITIELRYLSWNNKAPIIFKSLVDIVENNNDCFSQLIEPLIDLFIGIIENYHDEGFLYSYIAMDAFVEFVLRYNNLTWNNPQNPLLNDNIVEPYGKFKFQPYHEIYPAMNDNETLLEFYKKHVIHSNDFDNDNNSTLENEYYNDENDNSDENLQKCPPHLERVFKIMSLCVHFLNSRSETLQIMVHQLCCKCIVAFDQLEIVIYPIMHKLWDPLLYSINLHIEKNTNIKRSNTLAAGIKLLGVMCEFSGVFLKSRVIEQFFPVIERLYTNIDSNPCNLDSIKNIIPTSGPPTHSYYHYDRRNSEFEIALIQLIPRLVYHFDIDGVNLNFLTNCCIKFVQGKFALNVKKNAIVALNKLIMIEPYIKDLIPIIENHINWDKLLLKYHVLD